MLPEPYWDFNLITEQLNFQEMKKYLQRATKVPLKNHEAR
jgi:hypothetical protein